MSDELEHDPCCICDECNPRDAEIRDLRKALRESQTREAEQAALNARLREALEFHGFHTPDCCPDPDECTCGLKATLSLSGPSALAEVKAQVLREAADAYETDAKEAGERPLFAAKWLRERAALEVEAMKGDGDVRDDGRENEKVL